MKKIIILLITTFVLLSCQEDPEAEYVYPKDYLPAYPGSYWDYSNGERVMTSNEYVLHQYEISINSTEKSDEKYVPMYDNRYLYEYSITQSSTVYPIKQLLDESVGKSWVVNEINKQKVMRKVVGKLNSITIPFPQVNNPVDSIIKNVLVVVEYMDYLGEKKWHTKEYYAKNIGLVKVEINNPLDSKASVIQKQIQGYKINK